MRAWPAEGVVVVPNQFDDGIVRFRAGVGEKDLGHLDRRHLQQAFCQIDRRHVRFLREGMIVGQLAHLSRGRLDQPFLAKAERGAPQAGQALNVFLALRVVDVDALALGRPL